MSGRLNDNEVAQEMNKMVPIGLNARFIVADVQVAFIKQEALEKARETKIKVQLNS